MTLHELETIQQSGEGYMVEFKRNVNSDLAKELVAFANTAGGRIFIGIEDDGSIVGCAINNEINARNPLLHNEFSELLNSSFPNRFDKRISKTFLLILNHLYSNYILL